MLVAVPAIAAARLSGPQPVATVQTAAMPIEVVQGARPLLPWPRTGEAALDIPRLGVQEQSGPEVPVPIASLAKMMTAYIILHDHPLSPGADGPTVTLNAADVADYNNDVGSDQSSVVVQAGEQLTERQLLQGLLVRSANNFADILAAWDAGSVQAFVAKMNTTARALGLSGTHYADASGFDPHTVSTAADQVRLAAMAMTDATFAGTVDEPAVTLPVAGTQQSYTPLVGMAGVVGVKSGFTDQAGGCDVVGAYRQVGAQGQGPKLLVLVAVTGQEMADTLPTTGFEGLGVAWAAAAAAKSVRVIAPGRAVATVSAGGKQVSAVTAGSAEVLAWPGQKVAIAAGRPRRLRAGAPRGALVMTQSIRVGDQRHVVPVRLTRRIPSESLVERLF